MIYKGAISDPRHRFYVQSSDLVYNKSPEGIERYAKFRAQPVNLSRVNPSGSNLNNSHVYTKNGLLRRNQVGWDGVKLAQYVTQQLCQNFQQNQRILQKFRKQAQQNRRMKKYAHVNERFQTQIRQNESIIKQEPLLPQISPISHKQYTIQPSSQRYSPKLNPQQMFFQQEVKHYRNVGVNTNRVYQKLQLEKYKRLQMKYQSMKSKYYKQKTLRRIQKRRNMERQQQRQRQTKMRQKQAQSLSKQKDKIKQIQSQLVNISIKLQTSQQLLNSHLQNKEKEKHMQKQIQLSQRLKVKDYKKKQIRLKTQPLKDLQRSPDVQLNQQIKIPSIEDISIPKNPLQNLDKNQKTPRVIYSYRAQQNQIRNLLKYVKR